MDQPFAIGVGYESGKLNRDTPQPHSASMDLILTEHP
jgi:hypothetical protein